MKKKIRFAIAQMNPTVGDYSANLRKILAWIQKAEDNKADLIVFPEMALCGYPVWDLANKTGFVAEGLRCLDQIVKTTAGKKVVAVIGFIDQISSEGSRSANAMAWIQNGRLEAKYHKRLLPTYDVFLEDIFFESGKISAPIDWNGWRVGPTICEDLWDARYETKPLADLAKFGADLILNISASPYYRGVAGVRDALFKSHAAQHGLPILYVNQVGGQDDLVFDGRSFFVSGEGNVLFRAPAFDEDLYFFDWDSNSRQSELVEVAASVRFEEEVWQALVLGIRDYCRKNKFTKSLIGLSGGIDSALVAALAVDALGPKAVKGITMPSRFSSPGSWKDSEELAKRLGIECVTHPIRTQYEHLLKVYHSHQRKEGAKVPAEGEINLAMENLQARLRGMELMFFSNDEGRLLLTTGNKSEFAMGYCTLYGDMAGGLAVIGDVYKTDVYRLARWRNEKNDVIPQAIIDKAPSAELRPNQKDQDSLPPYEALDEILHLYIEKNKSSDEIAAALKKKGITRTLVLDVIRKVDHNEYKRRQTPPILRVSEKAWFGRRMPITNRFEV